MPRVEQICLPMRHCLWRLRPCPPSRYKQLQRLWASGTWQRVRLVHVCTHCPCWRHTRLTCWKRWMSARPWAPLTSWSSGETADFALRATKETARAIGESIAAMVAAASQLWLSLSDIKDKDRVFLLDAMLVPLGLFNNAVDSVIDRNQEDRRQAVALQRFLPCHPPAQVAAGWEQPQPHASSSYREAQRQRVATRDPPMAAWHVQSLSIP